MLENIRLEVREREFVTIVGASGCGKTTFLRLLLGETTPCEGAIELAGEPLAAEPDANRGVVFQRYSVFPHLTVLGNVLLGLELRSSRFPRNAGGALHDHEHVPEALEETRQVIDAGTAPALFEAAFEHEHVFVRPDVLERLPDGGWRLVEVKSTTKLKDVLVQDVAVQLWCCVAPGWMCGRQRCSP